MRKGLLGSIAALAASAGLAAGQSPTQLPARPAGSAVAGPGVTWARHAPAHEPLAVPAGPLDAGPFPGGAAMEALGAGGFDGPGGPDGLPRPPRVWAEGEFLLMWVKPGPNQGAQIVIGTVPFGAIPGTPGAVTVFGNGRFDYGAIAGARWRAGALFPGSERVGLEGSGMILPRRDVSAGAASGALGIPVIGIPFVNELTGQMISLNASSPANPGSAFGSTNTMMWTAEANLFANLYRGPRFSMTVLAGFKHFNLAEGIVLRLNRTVGSPGQTFLARPIPIGTVIDLEDRFDTTNRFYGANFGVDFEYRWRCWYVAAGFHNAVGQMVSAVDNSGFTRTTPAVGPLGQVPGGLLVQLGNFGRRVGDILAVVPEVHSQLGYQLTRNVRFGIGYTALYANHVARPGQQIDAVVNPTLLPLSGQFGQNLGGTVRPAPIFRRTDYWTQGVNFSLTLSF